MPVSQHALVIVYLRPTINIIIPRLQWGIMIKLLNKLILTII